MPEPSELDAVLLRASHVRLGMVVPRVGDPTESEPVVDLSHPDERDRLRTAMEVESLPGSVCMCSGDVRFEFLDPDGECFAIVALHHGATLRWDGWKADAVLADGRSLLRWLDEHGLADPLRQFEEDEARRARADAEEAAWIAAIPPALDTLREPMLALSRTGRDPSPELLAEARDRLSQAVSDPVNRVLLLLAWCGAGTGRCSGFPVHEKVPGLLLKDVPVAEIVAGLQDPRADGRHFAGAVRHLVGWRSRPEQKRDVAALPAPLRARLRQEAEDSGDPDTQFRAERLLA
jgi:hypothetical protein